MNNAVKSSACWIWRPKGNLIDHMSKDIGSCTFKRFDYVDPQGILKSDQEIFNSGCSRHMIGNKSYLTYYQEIDGGFLLDESQVLLKVPRNNNMYSFDLKNVVPLGGKFDGKSDDGFFVGYSINSKVLGIVIPAAKSSFLLNIVLKGKSAKSMTTNNDCNLRIRPPITAEEHQQARFGGNTESKKMQKSLLKQKFKEFKISEEVGLDKGYDKMQKILTQMNTLKIKPDLEDINMKFLRGLPSSWSGYSSSSSTLSNAAFVSTTGLIQGNLSYQESVNGGYGGYTTTLSASPDFSSSKGSSKYKCSVVDDVIYSFFANHEIDQQLVYEDLDQMNKNEFKEYDLKHQMAMLSIKVHRFEKKQGRKIKFNGRENARFDKKLVKCFNCKQMGHFSRECRDQGVQNSNNYQIYKSKEAGKDGSDSKAMVVVDGSIDWDKQTEEGNTDPRSLENFGMLAGIKLESDADSEGEVVSADDVIPADVSVSASPVAADVVSPHSETEFALMGLSTEVSIPVTCPFQECSRPNNSDHDFNSSVSAPASESSDTIVIDCDRQEDFPNVCTSSIETNVKSSKSLCNKFGSFNKGSHFRKHKSCYVCGSYLHLIKDYDIHEQRLVKSHAKGKGILGRRPTGKPVNPNRPKPVSAGQPNLVSVGQPNPGSAGQSNPVSAVQPNLIFAGPLNLVSGGQSNLISACPPNLVSAGQPNRISAGPPNPVYAGQPNPVSAGDGLLGLRPLNNQPPICRALTMSSRVLNFLTFKLEEIVMAMMTCLKSSGVHYQCVTVGCGLLCMLLLLLLAALLSILTLPMTIYYWKLDNKEVTIQFRGGLLGIVIPAAKSSFLLDTAKEGDKNGQENDVRDQEEALRKPFEQDFKRLNELESMFGQDKDAHGNSTYRMLTLVCDVGSSYVNLGGSIPINAATLPNTDPPMLDLEDTDDLQDTKIFSSVYDDEVEGAMDVKSTYLYGTIDEEVYVYQPPCFEDALFSNKVYVDDIIFGSTKKSLCTEFEGLMHKKFQMSYIGKLTFLLGLQVMQRDNGIFISQDKYVADILKKFDFSSVKTAITLIETNKALCKDEEAEDVDVYLYRSMIGSLMYLTASRPDIRFDVCACARDSPFDLEALSDSDYVGVCLDRKSTT
uniref:CCHC-type domain-containing protein n=1 Tax=Tanacetum cinerariifolium TaxID=118510 RepID=A0A6L2KUD1_TANCI|nr:hypothetical protein [Tanacetum cinerariifolium]